jgi:hydroxymethylpyrimidine/phosphomethylpyrimidine kinase
VFADLEVGAVKIGMLSQAAAITAIAQALDRHKAKNIVLDPVMIAASGARLLANDAVATLRKELIPRALLITPNLLEAAALTDTPIAKTEAGMAAQAQQLLAAGARNVLMKGGHGKGPESVDLLIGPNLNVRLAAPRHPSRNTHGTGCTLSSAVAAGLAKGLDLTAAVRAAKDYVTAAIAAADRLDIGHGHGPLHHFHAHW